MEKKEAHFQIKKGFATVTKTFRIPIPLAEELERLAAQNDISMNGLILQCIEFALNHLHAAE